MLGSLDGKQTGRQPRAGRMTMRTDEDLLASFARTREHAPFDELIRRHWAQAHRLALGVVGDGAAPDALANRALRELVNCYDDYGPASLETLKSANARARPPFRRAVTRDCEEWLPRFSEASTRTPVRSDIPTLITTGHFDDRTPTEHARRIASTLSRAYLVEFPDEGHDARPTGCHAAIVMQFLEDPTPKPDTSCVATIRPISFATTWEPAKLP